SFAVELTPAMMQNFLALSDDTNPLHLDREFATESGFREVVAYGMLTSALYSRLVGVYLPGRFCLLHGIQVDFSNPAYVGDQLRVRGEIAYLNEAFRRIEIKASIQTDSQVISKAKIKVGLNEH
ncbi:MAG: MaoC/PaaZ C-terminal domain-containing protein, partial [Candidatus Angelobacter sp.]